MLKELCENCPTYGKECTWERVVACLASRHADTWQYHNIDFWILALMAELGEASAAICGRHDHPWQWEVAQIAAIALNLLRRFGGPGPVRDLRRDNEPVALS